MNADEKKASLRADLIADVIEMIEDLIGAIVKTLIAYIALRQIGHLQEGEAFATATLLGATDFFARRGRSRFVKDIKERMTLKLPNGQVIEKEIEEHEEER